MGKRENFDVHLSGMDGSGGARHESVFDIPAAAGTRTGVSVGELVALVGANRLPLVAIGRSGAEVLHPRSLVDLSALPVGAQLLMAFEEGDLCRPVVIGQLDAAAEACLPKRRNVVEVEADGERLVVSAERQLVLRCGNASITLTHAGKVLIDGTYVLTRSSGVNRVKGASVQIN